MEKLWKRGIYVDIFDFGIDARGIGDCYRYARRQKLKKNNAISTALRVEGDGFFSSHQNNEAMKKYTSSLRYAENGTENVALAYDSRSNCFFRIGDYYRSSIDNEYAIQCYEPEEVPPRLLRKRETFIQFMKSGSPAGRWIKELNFGFDPHKDFPDLANVVDLKYDPKIGRHIVANCNIPQKKVILKEEYFTRTVKYDENLCYTCFTAFETFIPCENCTVAIFCDLECEAKNKTHPLECGSIFPFYGLAGRSSVRSICFNGKFNIQTVMNAIATFHDVEKLMDFVDRTLIEELDRPPVSAHTDEAKYDVYFKLKKFPKEDCLFVAKYSYELAMQIRSIRELFDTVEKQRFLMHLITHHENVNSTNSFGSDIHYNISNMVSFFNHSCKPNVATSNANITIGIITLRNIKKGEQLCISYLDDASLDLPEEFRQRLLQDTWGFRCECIKCKWKSFLPAFCKWTR